MIPPHLFFQIIISLSKQNDCTPLKCGELSEYTESSRTKVEDHRSRCMNESDEYDRCGFDTRQLRPCYTACRRTANLPSGKNILVNIVFTINIGYTRLGSRVCPGIAPIANMAEYPTKNNMFIGKIDGSTKCEYLSKMSKTNQCWNQLKND